MDVQILAGLTYPFGYSHHLHASNKISYNMGRLFYNEHSGIGSYASFSVKRWSVTLRIGAKQ